MRRWRQRLPHGPVRRQPLLGQLLHRSRLPGLSLRVVADGWWISPRRLRSPQPVGRPCRQPMQRRVRLRQSRLRAQPERPARRRPRHLRRHVLHPSRLRRRVRLRPIAGPRRQYHLGVPAHAPRRHRRPGCLRSIRGLRQRALRRGPMRPALLPRCRSQRRLPADTAMPAAGQWRRHVDSSVCGADAARVIGASRHQRQVRPVARLGRSARLNRSART